MACARWQKNVHHEHRQPRYTIESRLLTITVNRCSRTRLLSQVPKQKSRVYYQLVEGRESSTSRGAIPTFSNHQNLARINCNYTNHRSIQAVFSISIYGFPWRSAMFRGHRAVRWRWTTSLPTDTSMRFT